MFKQTQSSLKNKPNKLWLVFFILILANFLALYTNLSWGQTWISHKQIFDIFIQPKQESQLQNIIWDIRLPKGLAAALIGAGLTVSAAIIQKVTRNNLADPGLLGINSGAGLALIVGYIIWGQLHYSAMLLLCLIGSSLACLLVLGLSYQQHQGFTSLRLVLAGAMVASLLTAIGQGLTLYFHLTNSIIGWQAGGLEGTNWHMLAIISPGLLLGLLISQLLARQLTLLSLGEELAKGLGQQTRWMTGIFLGLVLLLSASAVSLAGSLSLIGLVLPHLFRKISNRDCRILLPLCALGGSLCLLICQLLANHLPGTPLNSLLNLLLLPVFLFLMRKGIFYEY